MIMLKVKGVYDSGGRIVLDTNNMIEWTDLSSVTPPDLPDGSNIEITISLDENDFLSGNRQAEIIKSALVAQHISSVLQMFPFGNEEMFLISITNESDINDAIDFIWRDDTGLRLKPDWDYQEGETNKSFEQWLSGH
ncbi:MAG: hypothetical protein P8Y79_10360 [Ignavibacteriaceae bacterium]